MAEFCLDCWNELNGTHMTEDDLTLSQDLDFCEECEEMKQVIVNFRRPKKRKREESKCHCCDFFARRK